ncbi:amidohydrolase family protein [Thiovibrio frasassiensis]|uniref:Amidohydrolase family protein n=1 Tax=Thiovibrio frasassiensis TaxID=2984131 RepID=A0A9X4MEB0_9BACT|nr:amidohydrolase family protein [Thiovibrio frasassiensis]MDG4474708.1 amidohydrolase family protein [Thiovibrio frasassiensis]
MAATRFIVAGSFIDGSGAPVRRNVFLEVTDTIITGIGSATDLPRNGGAAIDDFSHCIILPPLVDCSLSLSRSPSVDSTVRLSSAEGDLAQKAIMVARHLRDCHAHGVLGVADSDGTDSVALSQAGMAEGGIIEIRSSGPLCPSEDFVKVAYSANIEDEEGPDPRLSYEDLCRILQEKGGRKAVVVANGRQQVAEALAAGCDAIEQGYDMGEDNLRKMAEKGVLWIPSVVRAKNGLDGASSGGSVCCRFSTRYVAPGKPLPGAEDFWKKTLANQLAQLRLAGKFGVKTAVGTGAGSVGILHGESLGEEVKLFLKAGYSLEEAIRCASENGARFFGMEKLGTLTVGRQATFLIARGTLQQLPRKLSYLEGIYVDGAPSNAYRKNPVKTG